MPKKKESKKSENTTKKKAEIQEEKERSGKKKKTIVWLILIVSVIVGTMLSPIFTIKNIEVQSNKKVEAEEIIRLSGVSINDNMFWKTTGMIKKNVKANALIDKVYVTRALPDKLIIKVTERSEDYLLIESEGNYYINNQGYILSAGDVASTTVSLYGLSEHSITLGNRISEYNLKKLNVVNQIMNNCEDHYLDSENQIALSDVISKIDVTSISDITIEIKSEEKTIHIGDESNLNGKLTYIPKIIQETKGQAGDIYVNMNLSEKYPYFSPKRDVNKEVEQSNE